MLDDNEYLSPDAKMEIPEEGVKLIHADGKVERLSQDSVEIVTDEDGVWLYASLKPEYLDIIKAMFEAGNTER